GHLAGCSRAKAACVSLAPDRCDRGGMCFRRRASDVPAATQPTITYSNRESRIDPVVTRMRGRWVAGDADRHPPGRIPAEQHGILQDWLCRRRSIGMAVLAKRSMVRDLLSGCGRTGYVGAHSARGRSRTHSRDAEPAGGAVPRRRDALLRFEALE